MEQNLQGQTVNLGGNMINGISSEGVPLTAQQPIEPIQPLTVAQITTVDQSATVQQASINDSPAQQQQPDTFVVNVATLATMLQNIKNSLKIDSAVIMSLSTQLIFSPEGLTVKATDGQNVLIQEAKDIVSNDTFSVSVNTEILLALVSKITTEKLQLIPNDGKIIIKSLSTDTETFEFILLETHDTDGKTLVVQDPFGTPTTNAVQIDFTTFRDAVLKARIFMCNSNVRVSLNGVYISNGAFYSSDEANAAKTISNVITLPDNKALYLTESLVNMIDKLPMDNTKTFITYTIGDDGFIDAVQITDGTTSIHGPTNPDYDMFPIAGCERLFSTPLSNSFTADKKTLLNMLDKVALFIRAGADSDACNFIIDANNQTLTIESKNTDAKQVMSIKGNNLASTTFPLHVENTMKALKNIESDEVICEYIPIAQDNFEGAPRSGYVQLKDNNVAQIISYRF